MSIELKRFMDDLLIVFRDPLRLSQFLIDSAVSRGVKLHKPAQATTVVEDVNGTIVAVKIVSLDSMKESIIPCTNLF